MSDKIITGQSQDALALNRNMLPVCECGVHPKTTNGASCKAIDVPVLSCASVWLRVQKEAEAWIAPGGKLIADSVARNRQINRAYAQLWQADRRFQWAGLAAFASKQVGCGLLHAADNVRKSMAEIRENLQRADIQSNTDAAAVSIMPASISAGSAYMYGQLSLGNTLIFLDIYPLHRFYMLRGFAHMKTCLDQRPAVACNVIWPFDEKKISFGTPHPEIIKAFQFIDTGRIDLSVKALALHEHINILQTAIYDDSAMQAALAANQFSWATNFPSGTAAEIQLTLSAQCSSSSKSLIVWFSRHKLARLYDKVQRMEFVNRAADQFNSLLQSIANSAVEKSLNEIASGRIVP